MAIEIGKIELAVHNIETRMPFRYGIAVMTAVPHLFVQATCTVDGKVTTGIAADNLIPKWFTKDPDSTFADEVADMLAVIQAAATFAQAQDRVETIYELWKELYRRQKEWADEQSIPPLLWNFGVSLVERAVIDAACRAWGITLSEAVSRNRLGLRLGEIHPELAGAAPSAFLPKRPLRAIRVRHTVGLSDPLTDDDIPAGEQIDDGLPHSLAANIRAYGLDHFKLKVGGDIAADLDRLRRIAAVLAEEVDGRFFFTLDGNEQYRRVEDFRALWETMTADPQLRPFLDNLLFVEQPLYRGVALTPETGAALQAWRERPPMIIDESDATVDSLRLALEHGYQGTSHKNCKGIFKGIANACYLAYRRRQGQQGLLSGEDLANVGPVALLQDLAVMALLGIEHVERNGHHYFTGLSIFPENVGHEVLRAHPDLYQRHEQGYVALAVEAGRVTLGSVVEAPFGVSATINPNWFTPLGEWHVNSLAVALEENRNHGKNG